MKSRRALLLALGLTSATLGVLAACVGDDPITSPGASSSGTSSSTSTTSSGGQANPDGGGTCTAPRCSDPSTLLSCDGTEEKCRFECKSDGTPHCAVIQPSGNALKAEMFATEGLKELVELDSARFDTDTGAIDPGRAKNEDPLKVEVKDGIGFQVVDIDETHKIGVWMFGAVKVKKDAVVHFSTTHAAGFVVVKEATILGTIDLRGYSADKKLCTRSTAAGPMLGGPGGGQGSGTGMQPGGPGRGVRPKSVVLYYYPGNGGAGHGAVGGYGGGRDAGSGGFETGGDGGATYGAATLSPLLGGSGGAGARESVGGGGGGAFHLVAGEKVTIGEGTLAGINGGGCGGTEESMGGPGGSGGSGGSVLVETPNLDLRANAGIAVNGGSAGVGGTAAIGAGRHAEIISNITQAPSVGASAPFGGYGGGGIQNFNGGSGGTPSNQTPASVSGGSGGGGVGRIRLNTRTGSYTLPQNAILSPSPTALNSTTTVGTLEVR